jgi:hypothetical protein
MFKRETIYFEEGGEENTKVTLEAAKKAAEELGIKYVVVASTSGETGVKAAKLFIDSGIQLIVVGHQIGFPRPTIQQFKKENLNRIHELGGLVNLGTDVITNSIRRRQKLGHSPLSYVTQTLITMKVKVNLEIVAKACDAGDLPVNELCISVAGSHKGADTAIVFLSNDSANILDIKPREIIVMPLSRQKADIEYMAKRKSMSKN